MLRSYRGEKKAMESVAMVVWQIFVAIVTAGNRLRPKNGKKLWISKLEYQQHGIAMVTEIYGCIQTDTQRYSMDAKSMGTW